LQDEQNLDQRVPTEIPRELERIHDLFERHILMGVGAQGCLPHPPQELNEGRVAAEIRTQGQQVDEEPHKLFRLSAVPVGHIRTDQNIGLPRQLGQQQLEGSQQRHKQRHALTPAHSPQAVQEFLPARGT
jgi:hypothetical protein